MASLISQLLFKEPPSTKSKGRSVSSASVCKQTRFIYGPLPERILMSLNYAEAPLSVRQIGEKVGEQSPKITQALRYLRQGGLVVASKGDPSDVYTLSERGKQRI